MQRRVLIGATLLLGGAALVDLGFHLDQPNLERVGNIAMILAGAGLAYLPALLGPTLPLGRVLYWAGLALATLVDVPAVLDPADLRAGRLLGFPAMLLLSGGLLMLWRRTRVAALLVAAAWFFVQLAPNVMLFIIPDQRPSFTLQVIGVAVPFAVIAARTAARRSPAATGRPSSPRMDVRR